MIDLHTLCTVFIVNFLIFDCNINYKKYISRLKNHNYFKSLKVCREAPQNILLIGCCPTTVERPTVSDYILECNI